MARVNIKIACCQFEPKDGDKEYNLTRIASLSRQAAHDGSNVVCFHELSVCAYTHLKELCYEDVFSISETVPGESTNHLVKIARENRIHVLAGLVERAGDKLYNTYVCVNGDGVVASYRKLHPFISEYLSPGNEYVTFKIEDWTCGILICYDNNIVENVRATTLLGAEVIFAPHVTMLTPSDMPGRGYVEDEVWQNRELDPVGVRQEFDGPKGREWLMRWLPARAYDNGIYYCFTNPIGYDGEHLKNGNACIIDPYGELLAETRELGDSYCLATIDVAKLEKSGGYRYIQARRPELYRDILGKSNHGQTETSWLKRKK